MPAGMGGTAGCGASVPSARVTLVETSPPGRE
jgi:hypothetical protein